MCTIDTDFLLFFFSFILPFWHTHTNGKTEKIVMWLSFSTRLNRRILVFCVCIFSVHDIILFSTLSNEIEIRYLLLLKRHTHTQFCLVFLVLMCCVFSLMCEWVRCIYYVILVSKRKSIKSTGRWRTIILIKVLINKCGTCYQITKVFPFNQSSEWKEKLTNSISHKSLCVQ